MSRWLLALLLVATGAARAETRDAFSVLDACVAQLDRGLDIGYAHISARCPDLAPSLLESSWATWLPADWNKPDNQLSAQGLSQLRELLTRESMPAAAGRELHVERVGAVLARVTAPPSQAGWWPRFKRWLRDLFAPRASDERGWWRRLLGGVHLDKGVMRAIQWGSVALVTGLAVTIVLNELRIAGWLRSRRRIVRTIAADAARGGLTLAEIERASLDAQPALLLDCIAARLTEQDRLPPARAFTAQEVAGRARLPEESDRARLAELAAVCERVRFSGNNVPPQTIFGAVARGGELLSALATAAPAEPGAA